MKIPVVVTVGRSGNRDKPVRLQIEGVENVHLNAIWELDSDKAIGALRDTNLGGMIEPDVAEALAQDIVRLMEKKS